MIHGERTIFRVYIGGDGGIGYTTMLKGLGPNELLMVVGAMEQAKLDICKEADEAANGRGEISDEEVDDIRGLLDNDLEGLDGG